MEVRAFVWKGGELKVLNQLKLPREEEWLSLRGYREVAEAIKDMVVRGAPAIGCVAAYGFVLGVKYEKAEQKFGVAPKSGLLKKLLVWR